MIPLLSFAKYSRVMFRKKKKKKKPSLERYNSIKENISNEKRQLMNEAKPSSSFLPTTLLPRVKISLVPTVVVFHGCKTIIHSSCLQLSLYFSLAYAKLLIRLRENWRCIKQRPSTFAALLPILMAPPCWEISQRFAKFPIIFSRVTVSDVANRIVAFRSPQKRASDISSHAKHM